MRIVAVCQGRFASTRLPGKVMARIGGKHSIEWVVEAARRAVGVDEVVVATSINKENNIIEKWCRVHSTECFRGSENDVLSRYIEIIDKYRADAIVRLTCDCPLLDSRVIGEVIALYKATRCAYASNTEPPTYPDGLDCEVISADALRAAADEVVRQSDRDTVTRFVVRNRARFPAQNLTAPVDMFRERWVLDTYEDLAFMKALFAHTPENWVPNYLDILEILRHFPEIRDHNKMYRRNERFFENLTTETDAKRTYARSQDALERAEKTIPIGAQTFSKSRFQFPSGRSPLFVSHGDGGYSDDVVGNDYVDLVGALLPNVLGYRDSDIDYAVRRQLDSGVSLSLATELEAQLSEKLVKHIPCAEMARFGKTGSDATSAAVRLARAFTGRTHILSHGYHGWHDWAVAKTPRSLGSSPLAYQETSLMPFLSMDKIGALRALVATIDTAAIILEPEGWLRPELGYIQDLCIKNGILLIFDEVITGFRWDLGGYQKYVNVIPDLACFGKAMANGHPLSAVVGRRDIMMKMAPPDNIFYSGTFFGETLSLAASLATIKKMETEPVIQTLWDTGAAIRDGAKLLIKQHGLDDCIKLTGDAPLVRINFKNGDDFSSEDIKSLFIAEMAAAGVLVIASHNVCYAHGRNEITLVMQAYKKALGVIADGRKSSTIPKLVSAAKISGQGVRS